MQLGMTGLGRMGANQVGRLTCDGHECVVYDLNAGPRSSAARARARRIVASVRNGASGAWSCGSSAVMWDFLRWECSSHVSASDAAAICEAVDTSSGE